MQYQTEVRTPKRRTWEIKMHHLWYHLSSFAHLDHIHSYIISARPVSSNAYGRSFLLPKTKTYEVMVTVIIWGCKGRALEVTCKVFFSGGGGGERRERRGGGSGTRIKIH